MPDRTDSHPIETAYAQAAFFASLLAPVVAAIGYCSRLGFPDNRPSQWLVFIGASWFLIHFSYAARKLLRTSSEPFAAPWWHGHAPLTIAGLVIMTACGVEQVGIARTAAMILAILGAAALFARLAEQARSVLALRSLWLVGFALLLGLYAAGSVWGGGFENPLFIANVCNGYAHIDTLFHATLANMLRTYGACSTGLDGLPHVLYHFGSHWTFARLANLFDVPVIDFYNLTYPVIFPAFTMFCLMTFAVSVAEIWRGPGRALENAQPEPNRPGRSLKSAAPQAPPLVAFDAGFAAPGRLFWFVLAAGVIGVLPLGSGVEPLARAAPIFVSESYGLAIAVALLGIAAVTSLSRDIATAPEMRSVDVLLGFVFLCTLPAIVGLLKISVMLLLAVAAAWFFVRLQLYRCKVTAPSFAIGIVILYCGFLFTYNPEYKQGAGIAPFNALKALVGFTWWSYYWLFCYVWTLIFVVLRLREEGAATLGEMVTAFRERRLLDVELVLIVAILGSVPEILLADYSSTHYFASDQQWLALGLTLAIVLRPLRAARLEPTQSAESVGAAARVLSGETAKGGWLDRISLPRVLASLLALFAVGTFALNTDTLLNGVAFAVKTSMGLAPSAAGTLDLALGGNLEEARKLGERQAALIKGRLETDKNVVALLQSLDRLPLAEKRRSLLYIPKSNRQFWDLLHTAYAPKDGPLVAPALSGIAMLDGLYDRPEGDLWAGYGYQHYTCPVEKQIQPPLDKYLPTLKKRCVELGMDQLIVIDEHNGRSEVRKFDCP